TSKVEAGGDHRLRQSDVLVERNFTGFCADKWCDLVAHLNGHLPPAFFPSAHTPAGPRIGIPAQTVVYAARHCAEGVADHVGGAIQNREFLTPFEQFIHFGEFLRRDYVVALSSRQGSTAR